MIDKSETNPTLNNSTVIKSWRMTSTATFILADLIVTVVFAAHKTIISLSIVHVNMYCMCVVLISGSFVVAMQKRAMCHISTAIIWSCDLVRTEPLGVWFTLVFSDKTRFLKEATFLHESILTGHDCVWIWLIQEALELIFFLLQLTHYLFAPLEEPRIVGGLIHQKLWFQHADFFKMLF